ncbi:hypothetical protein [Allorhodopirellula heiligendammensis]|uniref:Uncharacterized protein n=1 Tax=Allorhodopirellula heiligendammensis TaxID=2714739 RepID=A0A5C6BHH8_9BACT|nr:hypothetical protein [Allorhodopirellula heiligendammensis]TWU10981.1 hypothetical protein Poly21_48870 [Allorhodopirellula heiligendammensis]
MSTEQPQTIRVQCPQCAKPLTLNESLLGKQIKCPLCGRVFATRAKASSQQSTNPAPSASASGAAAGRQPSTRPAKDRTEPTSRTAQPHPFDFPAVGAGAGHATFSTARPNSRPQARPKGTIPIGSLLKKHWLAITVSLLAVATLAASVIAPWPLFIVGIAEIVLGAIVVGLLFIPRMYVMRRAFGALGKAGELFLQSAATIGSGGVAIIVILAIVKAMRRTNGGASLDFSGITGGGIAVFLLFPLSIAAVIALWYLIGLARTLASGYVLQCSLMFLILLISVVQNPGVNPGGAMPPTDPVFRTPPRRQGRPTPPPEVSSRTPVIETPNPLGYPSSDVVHFIVDTSKISDIEKILPRLTAGAPPKFWKSTQEGSQLDVWLYQSAPVDQIARRVSGDRSLVVDSVDPAKRTIRVRGE